MNCLTCGACCKLVMFPITNVSHTDQRWFKMHKIQIKEGYAIFSQPCFNYELEKHSCRVYYMRPSACIAFKQGSKECLLCRKVLEIKD